MDEPFVSHAFQDLPRKKVVEHGAQYDGIDMAHLMGADEENLLLCRKPIVARS